MVRKAAAQRATNRRGALRVAVMVDRSMGVGRDYLKGIVHYSQAHAPWVLLMDYLPERLDSIPCDGVVGLFYDERTVAPFLKRGIPIVNMGTSKLDLPTVRANNHEAGRMGAEHLMERGFERFAFFGSHRGATRERYEGFVERVKETGRGVEDFMGGEAEKDWETRMGEVAGWITGLARPVGMMGGEEMAAWTVVGNCLDLGIDVPESVAVVTAGNDEILCEAADVPLSSVAFPGERIGFLAAQVLDEWMRKGKRPKTSEVLSPVGVVTRQSTDTLAIDEPAVAEAVRLIRENACKGFNVEDVLRKVAVDRRWLERQFRSRLGRSPYEEILRVRVNRARLMLSSSEAGIPQIAETCGFGYVQNFGEVFRKQTGWTPAAFRREFRGKFRAGEDAR